MANGATSWGAVASARVMKTGGVQFSGDVLRIRDLAPEAAPKRPPKTPQEEQLEMQQAFRPEYAAEEGDAEETVRIDVPGPEAAAELADVPEMPPEPRAEPAPAAAAEPDYMAAAVEPPPVAPAPPAQDVSEEIIQSAVAEAGRILEEAVHKAEAAREEALQQAREEADRLRDEAVQEGRRQGMTEAGARMDALSGEVVDAVSRFEGGRAAFEAEYEEHLKWLSIEIASKVLAKKVSEDDAVLAEMVDKAVQSVRSEPWIRVDVAQEMTRLIDRLTELYAEAANVEVSAVPAAPGTVQLETPSGLVDVSLRTQLENLRGYFAQGAPPAPG